MTCIQLTLQLEYSSMSRLRSTLFVHRTPNRKHQMSKSYLFPAPASCQRRIRKRLMPWQAKQTHKQQRSLRLEPLEGRQLLAGDFLNGVSQGDVSANPIDEASGLAASQLNTDVLWTHNDSGDFNRIFALNTQGDFLGSFVLAGAANDDYEDIAIGKGPIAGTSYIYVGDIGDNDTNRSNIQVYRVPEPTVSSTGGDQSQTLSGVDTITLDYPGNERHNAETLLADPFTGDLVIVTKHDSNNNRVYRAAAPGSGDQTITLEFKGTMSWSTAVGGDVSPNGREIIIKSRPTVWVYDRPVGMELADALVSPVSFQNPPYTEEDQGEAITFDVDGVDYYTLSESVSQSSQPLLHYARTNNATAELSVKHTPRLQLGNAPLDGFAGSDKDRIQVLWQTVPGGSGTEDDFVVQYRAVGDALWENAGATQTINTNVENRVNRYVDIDALDYDRTYEYRVRHLRAGFIVDTYQNVFDTRLPAGDTTSFSFAAYGDSAYTPDIVNFRAVQGQINQSDAAFAVLLGDAVYNVGSHPESDARFDATINPEATTWNSGHIDYLGFGNHDIGTASGQPSEENFASPIPEDGGSGPATAPAEPPASERDEHNYSFDYGNVHFVTFDTNSLNNATRLNDLLTWVEADLAASTAQWNVVFVHHPVAGVPDKPENPSGNYYQQVVPRLRAAGVDLFATGHSHTYSWTFPLLGESGGQATFVQDMDKDYAKGAGLVQVVSGVAGKSLRLGSYSQFPFVASGFTTDTTPAVEDGFTLIDVTPGQLTVKYIAADDGATIDQFTITDVGDVTPPTADLIVPDDNGPNDLDPAAGSVSIATVQSDFQIQLLDAGDGVDDTTVSSQTVSLAKGGLTLTESVDYVFSYNNSTDVITLTPISPTFDDGNYDLTLNGGASLIADLAGNNLAMTP